MVLSMDQYIALRKEFLHIAKNQLNSAALNYLKDYYKVAINSVRDSDYIENIEDLIRVLEKRSCIKYDNITPLKHIAKLYLKSSTIIDTLDRYNAWLESYKYPYSPQTNLYKLRYGECYSNNIISKNLSHLMNSNHIINPSLRDNFPYRSPTDVISNDLSNCNDSTVPLSPRINPSSAEISVINNFSINSNYNNDDKRIKDSEIHGISYETNNVSENLTDMVVFEPPLTSDLIFETEIDHKPHELTHSSTDDVNILLNTPLLSTPRSVQPETEIRSSTSLCHSLKRSSSQDIVQIKRNVFNRFLTWKFVTNILIVSSFAIILTYLLIAFGFSKNPVNYNPEPSAPSFQEAHTGSPAISSHPHAGYGFNYNTNAGHNLLHNSTGPLQTLNAKEARLQATVFEKVSIRLGKSWVDMARYLDIRECDINNIDNLYPTYQEKAYVALKMFADDTNLDLWQKTLKKALERARRADLRDLVEELASRNF